MHSASCAVRPAVAINRSGASVAAAAAAAASKLGADSAVSVASACPVRGCGAVPCSTEDIIHVRERGRPRMSEHAAQDAWTGPLNAGFRPNVPSLPLSSSARCVCPAQRRQSRGSWRLRRPRPRLQGGDHRQGLSKNMNTFAQALNWRVVKTRPRVCTLISCSKGKRHKQVRTPGGNCIAPAQAWP